MNEKPTENCECKQIRDYKLTEMPASGNVYDKSKRDKVKGECANALFFTDKTAHKIRCLANIIWCRFGLCATECACGRL